MINIVKSFILFLLKLYQGVSKFTPASCRYYPSCSEYTKQQYSFNTFFKASFLSTKRIVSCNPLFIGGIDYPIVEKIVHICTPNLPSNAKIAYWFVPTGNKKKEYYLIKTFKSQI
jgi:putative membrane protein insertion efficiency factor